MAEKMPKPVAAKKIDAAVAEWSSDVTHAASWIDIGYGMQDAGYGMRATGLAAVK